MKEIKKILHAFVKLLSCESRFVTGSRIQYAQQHRDLYRKAR